MKIYNPFKKEVYSNNTELDLKADLNEYSKYSYDTPNQSIYYGKDRCYFQVKNEDIR